MAGIEHQYRIIASGTGWIERSGRGRVRIEGRDTASFLQALVSNDVIGLPRGAGRYATYLTPQGRMLADLELYHRGDWWLAAVAPGRAAFLAERLDQSIFSEDVRVADISGQWAELFVAGGTAIDVVARAVGVEVEQLAWLSELEQVDWQEGFVAKSGDAVFPAFKIFVPIAAREATVAALEKAGALPMSEELAESLRIEAGRPAFGIDTTEETIPLEAGLLERAISTTKGCYVGQEIVIRILHRGGGRVAKRLAVLAFDPGESNPPPVESVLLADGKEVGRVTSAGYSGRLDRRIALGYVHRDAAEMGRRLQAVSDAGSAPAEIIGFAG